VARLELDGASEGLELTFRTPVCERTIGQRFQHSTNERGGKSIPLQAVPETMDGS